MTKLASDSYSGIFEVPCLKEAIVYGTGTIAKKLLQEPERLPFAVVAVMDNSMHAGTFMGVPVISQTDPSFPCRDIVVAASIYNCAEIYERISPLEKQGLAIHFPKKYQDYIEQWRRYAQDPDDMRNREVAVCGCGDDLERLVKERRWLSYAIAGVLDIDGSSRTDMELPVIDIHSKPFPYRHVVVAAPENKCESIYNAIAFLEDADVRIHLPVKYGKYQKALLDNKRRSPAWAGLFDSPVLDSIGIANMTDKSSGAGVAHDYLRKYELFLRPFRDIGFTLMEFGIYKGSSLNTWNAYFTNAKLIGVDIDREAQKHLDSPVQAIVGNLGDPAFVQALRAHNAHVIIDDASHRWDHQLLALFTLYPHMPPKGIYIVEDIHTSFQPLAEEYNGDEEVPPFFILRKLAEYLTLLGKNHNDPSRPFQSLEPPCRHEEEIKRLAAKTDAVVFLKSSCILVRNDV